MRKLVLLFLLATMAGCASGAVKLKKNCVDVGVLPDTQEKLSSCDEL